MISRETYSTIQEYRRLGLSKAKTSKHLGVSISVISKWWETSEEVFVDAEEQSMHHMDQFREYIISLLKVCPQIRDTNIRCKLEEHFSDFHASRSSFGRYMKKLREQTGYIRPLNRAFSAREDLPPGYEAQADFGQFKMKDMYRRTVRVYFFCMVLSYSRMKYAFFQKDPFTTESAIQAHILAFQYFGGRTQTILYDQDRVFVVSENLGNIVFVEAFEAYIKQTGFSVTLCRPRDPQTKGKIEEVVGHIKHGFLDGRTYTGIDCLNSSFLNWLDHEGNGKIHAVTGKPSRELFRKEAKHLQKVEPVLLPSPILDVSLMNTIQYQGNRYIIPKEAMMAGCRVRIETEEDMLLAYHPTSGDLLGKYPLTSETGKTIASLHAKPSFHELAERIQRSFEGNDYAKRFIDRLKNGDQRYAGVHLRRLCKMLTYYQKADMIDAMTYCVEQSICTIQELSSFLVFAIGEGIAKEYMKPEELHSCLPRAKEIKEVLYGKHQ